MSAFNQNDIIISYECMEQVSSLRTADAIKVIKTWSNGWTTSYRMHEEVLLNCLFGCCGKPDDLSHYLQCPILCSLSQFMTGFNVPDPLTRWGIKNSSLDNLVVVCCMFSGYHAIRSEIRSHEFKPSYSSSTLSGQGMRMSWCKRSPKPL